jgi:polyisoprenyl-teichoic acid--peptidoglycan teichoic acid transferase
VALGVLFALAVAFAVYLAADDPAPPSGDEAQPRTQRTLLLQVRGPDDAAVASALLARDAEEGTAGVLLVPPQVLVTVPGTGSLPFGRALATSPEGSRNALSDLLGVTVDDGWVLPTAALAALVDALGGVTVDVDVPVVQGNTVLLAEGAQLVDGARAVQFALYLGPDEQEQVRLARQQEVLDGIVVALPDESGAVQPLLTGLQGAESTLEPPALAELLVGLKDADADSALQYDSLPVLPIDTGAGVAAFRIDPPRVETVVDRLFADSVPPGVREGGNRVLVLNGVGTPGLGEQVRARLAPAGFVFVGSRNAPRFGYDRTQVLVPEATPEAQALGERVAEALGLPDAFIGTQPIGTVADVVVVVGSDFRPSP